MNKSRLSRFARDKRGNVAIIAALTFPMVIGGTALGVETTFWYYKRLGLQSAADAAAFAAAMEQRSGSDASTVQQVAAMAAEQNGFDASSGTITVVPTVNGETGSVQVILDDDAPRYFTAYFSKADVDIGARATASYDANSDACILALHKTAGKAAAFSGNSSLTLTGCSVMSNSNASNALTVEGSADLSTECVMAVGGVTATAGLILKECDAPMEGVSSAADPFKDLAAPTKSGPCKEAPNKDGTIEPGYYCNGMALKGNVTLEPGDYYVEGDFSTNSTANISGTGVFIYITGGGRMSTNGTAQMNLTAQTTGEHKGMLFFGDRTDSGATVNKINGNSSTKLTGAIYFPTQAVQLNGSFAGIHGCTQVVALTVDFKGNAGLANDCSAYGMETIPAISTVRLTA